MGMGEIEVRFNSFRRKWRIWQSEDKRYRLCFWRNSAEKKEGYRKELWRWCSIKGIVWFFIWSSFLSLRYVFILFGGWGNKVLLKVEMERKTDEKDSWVICESWVVRMPAQSKAWLWNEGTSKQSRNEHYNKEWRSELNEFYYIIPRKVARSKQLGVKRLGGNQKGSGTQES